MRRCAIAVLILILCGSISAQAEVLGFKADPDGNSCEIADPGPNGLITVYVLVRFSAGVTGVQFAAPIPPEAGYTYLAENCPYYPIGNSQSLVSFGLGQCMTGDFVVMDILFYHSSAGNPCTPYKAQNGAIYTDCNFGEHPLYCDGVALNSNGQCNPVPIRNPSPANQAIDVPLTVELNWDDAYYICDAPLAPQGTGVVYFGTASPPPYSASATANHTVGPLTPSTTYYWRIYGDYPYVSSPTWSFTTTSSTPAHTATWGAIKALYR